MILLGVSGGIAAVKTPELVKQLESLGHEVHVVMTQSATHIVSCDAFARVSTRLFEKKLNTKQILSQRHVEHIDVADKADLFVIVPATANIIAKLAHGIADDYLTTLALAVTCPVLVCPSMNVHMWEHPATRQNVKKIHSSGYHTFGPDNGMLACGYTGSGRLPEVSAIISEIQNHLNTRQSLKRKKVIVTTGGTIEPIDDVRQITNKSSGKMGVAIAQSCFLRGADVTLLRSTTSVTPRYGMKEYMFDTPESLHALVHEHAPSCDLFFHVAAVSDFSVKNKQTGKISSKESLPLELEPRSKILDSIKALNSKMNLVAFKAECNVTDAELVSLASGRLKESGADFIVANDVGRTGAGFQSDENEVFVIDRSGKSRHIPLAPKQVVADRVVDIVTESV